MDARSFFCGLLLLLFADQGRATPPKLDLCDVTWLWPPPQTTQDLKQVLAIGALRSGGDGDPVWSDEQFEDVLRTADGDFAVVQDHRISLPAAVRKKDVWRIAAFRADPTAPGGHELIRRDFGEKPQLRLILQPVTVDGSKVIVHDIAIHAVYNFVLADGPDRRRFREIVHDLDALKAFAAENGVSTAGRPLGVHPGLGANVPGLADKLQAFLEKHLRARDLGAMAIMGLDGPEPWLFVALGKVPSTAPRFGPIPFLPAQMLSFRGDPNGAIAPRPRVNNLNPVLSKVTMPAEEKDRRGVATADLFGLQKSELNSKAVVGKDADGKPVRDEQIRNRDIPDVIADPIRSHFFNTDCLSCHTETRRRLRLEIAPGKFAFLRDGRPPQIDPASLPKDDWNVRNLGWFPPHPVIGGGPTVPSVTQRTANETAEVVDFIERNYRAETQPAAPAEKPEGDKSGLSATSPSAFSQGVTYLEQGWSDDERQQFYYLGQGSQLLPYVWFLCLEAADAREALRSDARMRTLGFIPQAADHRRNPDGLPIGLVKDSNPAEIAVRRPFLGSKFDDRHYPRTHDWLGLTCAACHTSELRLGEKRLRIDGGAAMVDVESFLGELAKSLRKTAEDDDAFLRFEKAYRQVAGADADTSQLRDELQAYAPVMEALVARNKGDRPYGLGRLDAFGAILNQICAAGLNLPENRRPSDAPVSYPFLWYTPELDWVQWNSSVENPISRNAGEVLGVFAHAKLTGMPADGQFASTVRIDYLDRLETTVAKLKAPAWPEDLLGKIDRQKAEAGRKLFAANCAQCHNMRGDDGEYRRTAANPFGRTFIQTTSIPFQKIGTDPRMIVNFLTRLAKPGALAPAIRDDLQSPDMALKKQQLEKLFADLGLPKPNFDEQVPAGMLLKAAVRGVIDRHIEVAFVNRTADEKQAMLLQLSGFHGEHVPPHGGAGYKARPLEGIWATAPYGHAGSVPNLFQWLLPEERRVKNFRVGDLEFDPRDVGFSTMTTEGGFAFVAEADGKPIPGNSNRGHSGDGMTNFTDEQRREIIEFLKSLR